MHVYACFLLCFISMFACLDLGFAMLFSRRGLAHVGLWDHLLVTACETHLRDVGVLDTYLSTPCAMMLCLPCLLCDTYLAFFTSLHLCTHAYMFKHGSLLACVIKPNSYYLVWVHTCLWYTSSWVPYRNFVWWHVCHPYSKPMELWTPNPNLRLSS